MTATREITFREAPSHFVSDSTSGTTEKRLETRSVLGFEKTSEQGR